MLTNDEIRALNDARTILDRVQAGCAKHRRDAPDNYTEPDGWDYGRVNTSAHRAEWSIFQVLNEIASARVQLIPEILLHNREDDPIRNPGRAEIINVESEDDGFHLHIDAEHGRYVFVIGDGFGLIEAAGPVQEHWAEARRAAAEHQRQIDDGTLGAQGLTGPYHRALGYDRDDPKHPDYHDKMSDLSDRRKP
jgi:hypothetical protein